MKIRLLVPILIIAIGLLTACAPPRPTPTTTAPTVVATATPTPRPIARPTNTPLSSPTPQPTRTPTPSPVRLVLWENLPPAQAQQLAADVVTFSRNQPDYLIDIQHYDGVAALHTAILEDRVDYDLILGPVQLVGMLQQAGRLQPLDDVFPADFLDAFAGPTLTGASYRGRLWGLPDTAGFHLLLFYNRDLIERPPATTTELVDLAAAMEARDTTGLVMNSYDPLWIVPWLWAYGGWLTDGDGTPTLDTAAMEQALTLHQSWHAPQTGIAPPLDYVAARELFVAGQAALLIDGAWAIDALSQEANLSWSVAPLPAVTEADQGPGPLVLARYWALGDRVAGRRAEAAVAFLTFATEPTRQLNWTAEFGLLPTRRNALAAPALLNDPALRISAQQLQNGRGVPLNTDLQAILDAMRQPLIDLLAGQLAPADAAARMQAEIR